MGTILFTGDPLLESSLVLALTLTILVGLILSLGDKTVLEISKQEGSIILIINFNNSCFILIL